jgi:hypothetical protein
MMRSLNLFIYSFIYSPNVQVFIQNPGQACDATQISWIKIYSIPTTGFPTGRNVDQLLHSETFHVLYLTLRPNQLPYGTCQDKA